MSVSIGLIQHIFGSYFEENVWNSGIKKLQHILYLIIMAVMVDIRTYVKNKIILLSLINT